jgi:hypothetical protein
MTKCECHPSTTSRGKGKKVWKPLLIAFTECMTAAVAKLLSQVLNTTKITKNTVLDERKKEDNTSTGKQTIASTGTNKGKKQHIGK